MPNLLTLISYILISAFTPGPNNIMAMVNASKYGLKKALFFCGGVVLGFLVITTLAAIFTSLLFEYIPVIKPFMKWIGAAYILWLAFTVIRDKPQNKSKEPLLHPSGFLTGILLQFVNAKAILYSVTVFSTFVLPYDQSFWMSFLFVLILPGVGVFSSLCWALFGSLFQKFYLSHKKAVNIVMALLLVYCAVSVFL